MPEVKPTGQRLRMATDIGTTTAGKMNGTSSGLDADRFLFLVRPLHISHYCSTPVSRIHFPTPLSHRP